eukprot:scaffold77_cov162-Amphora_coffeaeformis.AAC.6
MGVWYGTIQYGVWYGIVLSYPTTSTIVTGRQHPSSVPRTSEPWSYYGIAGVGPAKVLILAFSTALLCTFSISTSRLLFVPQRTAKQAR